MASEVPTSTAIIDWQTVDGHFGQLHADQERLFQLLEQSHAELDGWRQELDQREQQLADEREELLQQRQALQQAQTAGEQDSESVSAALHSARDELAAVRRELQANQRQLTTSQGATDTSDEENTSLRKQCALLEVELETVRARAAELTDALEHHQREGAEQQAQWSLELNEMQQQLDQQGELLAQAKTPPASAAAAPSPVPAAAATQGGLETGPNETVVGSVMAQFARLSRERADRRVNAP